MRGWRIVDLFSGIGGFALAARMAGLADGPTLFCELDPFCREVLAKHWPGTRCEGDVRDVAADPRFFVGDGAVDLVTGGFPCQPFSDVGQRSGVEDPRHLWPFMLEVIRGLSPRWVLAENVPGLRLVAADLVLSDLESAGYACWPFVVGARRVGAPHERNRVWIVAHSEGERLQGAGLAPLWEGFQARRSPDGGPSRLDRRTRWPAGRGEPQHDWEPDRVESSLGGRPDGVSRRLGRWRRGAVRAFGNAIVPQVAAEILASMAEYDDVEEWQR